MLQTPAPQFEYVCIRLLQARVDMRIGLHPWENKPQPVEVDMRLFARPEDYFGAPLTKDTIIDYDRIHNHIQGWATRPHVKLIEPLVLELLTLAFSFESVMAAQIAITKPAVFSGAALPGIEVFMTREKFNSIGVPLVP